MYCEEQFSTHNLRLIFVNDVNGHTKEQTFMIPFFPTTRELRLNEALDDTCQRTIQLQGAKLFQVDFANKMNRYLGVYPFERQIRINYDTVVNDSIQIHFQPSNERYGSNFDPAQFQKFHCLESTPRQRKVKERSIQQAVEAVKQWRILYDTDDGTGKRLYTLDEAAKMVGIAKKTLDDYYSLIRTGMSYNFNLQNFKQQKIGILRKFVKIAKQQGQQGIHCKMSKFVYEADIEKYFKLSDF